MRIVAGSAKGVRLASVPPGVRPLSDRAREGLFSSLGPGGVEGRRVLDLYAGTGAVGIEALSRGAAEATFVERSARAVAAIRRNLELTGTAERASVEPSDVRRFLRRTEPPAGGMELVLCDAPYGVGRDELGQVLDELARRWLVSTTWDVVLTRGHRSSMPVIPIHWALARTLRYGDSSVALFRPSAAARDLEDRWA